MSYILDDCISQSIEKIKIIDETHEKYKQLLEEIKNPKLKIKLINEIEDLEKAKLYALQYIEDFVKEKYTIDVAAPSFESSKLISKDDAELTDLFNLCNRVSVIIDIDEEELQKIQDDNCNEDGVRDGRKPKIYRRANSVVFKINDCEWIIENVGIRQRGNTSRNDIFIDGKLNNENHFKLSFEETFTDVSIYGEEYVAKYGNESYNDRTFLKMDSIDLKYNKCKDLTHVKEIYASRIYRAAGCIYQHIGLCSMRMNDTDFGLCNIFESSGNNMLKLAMQSEENYINMATWKEEKKGTHGIPNVNYGDYYKIQYGVGESYRSDTGGDMSEYSVSENRVGVKEDPYGRYVPAYERKTNKKVTYDDKQLKDMVKTQSLPDENYFAIEEAVSFFIGNPDSWMYNYNNCKIYFRRTDGKMIIIPIDNDRAFGIGETWVDGLKFVYDVSLTPHSDRTISSEPNHNYVFMNTLLNEYNITSLIFDIAINTIVKSGWLENDNFLKLFEIAKDTYNDFDFTLSNGDNISFQEFINVKIEACKDILF